MSITHKPRIALTLGDPAGIGSELIARLLADETARNAAYTLIIADRDELEDGMKIAGVTFPYRMVNSPDALADAPDMPLLLNIGGQPSGGWQRSVTSPEGGKQSLDALEIALELAQKGTADAVVFAPLNKSSLHQAGMAHSDELHWFAEKLGHDGSVSEFNVLDDLWTSRVTSHVALKEVPALITGPKIIEAARLIHTALIAAGNPNPRIGICGLNPHNGDNGSFGREEIEIITPAVEEAKAMGLPVEGPYPADTIFLKAVAKELDAIVTLYHDQGQIAVKLLGFWKGVTVQGGLPVPIATPAHGTAFDIRGKGLAKVGPTRAAWDIACRMGAGRQSALKKD